NIYSVGKVVNVEIPAGVKGDIVVYNLLGSEIARKAVEANSLNKINLNVPSGYYLVKVNGASYSANGKVFIR
ncbi:MAG: T9SS type A sorting domain-containing protein, partial [Bacteroidia bacterium]